MQANLGVFLSPKSNSEVTECCNEDLSEFYSYFHNTGSSTPENLDRNERKRVKNCHRERCRVQKLNFALHRLNMLLPQSQRNPANGKHFSKAIILETCCEFIYQLENHVFGLFFEKSETAAAGGGRGTSEDCISSPEKLLSSLLSARRERHNNEGQKDGERIKRPKNSFILFSMGQRKQLLKENPCLDNNKVSKILGEKWKNLDEKSKAEFNQLAKIEKSKHKLKFPHFNYTIKRKRPRPITRKSVETAVSDYLDRDGSFSKLHRLMGRFPSTFSMKDIILCSFKDIQGDSSECSMDAVKSEDLPESEGTEGEHMCGNNTDLDTPTYSQRPCSSYGITPPLSLPELFPSHPPFSWTYPFDDVYLQQAVKLRDSPMNFSIPTSEYPHGCYMGYQEMSEELVTFKEEFDYEDDSPQLPDSTQPPAEFVTPGLFYYPVAPTQIISQIEPVTSTYPHVPLFALPPISQLISHEN